MKIYSKALNSLTKKEYRACLYLNLRNNGLMMYSLMENKNSGDAYAVMAWEGERLLGWALLIPHCDERNWYSTTYQKRVSKFVTQFYVRATCRQKGVGTALMRAVNVLDSRPTVIPHDPISSAFFASHDVVTEAGRRGMITEAKNRKKARVA